jgi:hypothetical protein
MASTTTELAYRQESGIEVGLFWDSLTGRVTVSVRDVASGDAFEFPVSPDRALDGFHHPYAYAASMGVAYEAEAPEALLA